MTPAATKKGASIVNILVIFVFIIVSQRRFRLIPVQATWVNVNRFAICQEQTDKDRDGPREKGD